MLTYLDLKLNRMLVSIGEGGEVTVVGDSVVMVGVST